MKALSVQGGGAELESTSGSVGLSRKEGPSCNGLSSESCVLDGREGITSSMDIVSSSSASQSETMTDERGEVSGGGVER